MKNIKLVSTFAMSIALTGALAGVQSVSADEALVKSSGCVACHAADKKLVGPSYKDIAAKYKDDEGAADALAGKITAGSTGVWGKIPMPPNAKVSEEDAKALAAWILQQ